MNTTSCPICACQTSPLAGFCPQCDTPLGQAGPKAPPPPQQRVSKTKWPTPVGPPPPPRTGEIARLTRPKTENVTLPPPRKPVHSTHGARILLAHLTDFALIGAVGVALVIFGALSRSELSHSLNVPLADLVEHWLLPNRQAILTSLMALTGIGILYISLVGMTSGQTLGRRLAGVTLVRRQGPAPSGLRVLTRSVLAIVSALCFGAGYFWAVVDPYHRTWHDVLCNTVLVHRER
jgi:uncharacterized RDD family membrane protein YckC